jgi:hypothetical protein
MTDPRTELLEALAPIVATVAALDLSDPRRAEATLAAVHPPEGAAVRRVSELVSAGIPAGWLCNRGEAHARFSRLAKPNESTLDLSIDVVSLDGAAIPHVHPRGEVSLGFAAHTAADPGPTFDGRPPGWVVYEPGSSHTPTVDGGRMHLVYFLPGGAIEWLAP